MKILEINKFNFPNAGADRHFLDLVSLLRSKGHQVAVFAMEHPQDLSSPWKKYFVSYVGYNPGEANFWQLIKGIFRIFYSFEARIKIKKLLDDFEPDIVHIHNIYHQISPSILSEIKKKKIPVAMTVHDYSLVCPDYLMHCNGLDWEKIKNKGWLYFVKNRCFKNSYFKSLLAVAEFEFHRWLGIYEKNIDLYIAPSLYQKNILVKNGMIGSKISVLPHFFKKIENDSPDIISGRYVFYAGRVAKDKGAVEMIRVFEKVKDIQLYIAGKKEEGIEIKSDNIKYLGILNPEEVEKHIKNSLFVVSFSRLPETFGLFPMESISLGKPFVGYKTGAYSEIIENEKTGYLCETQAEIEEKIKKLWEDEGLRILFSRNALEMSKKFESKGYYSALAELFYSLTKKKK